MYRSDKCRRCDAPCLSSPTKCSRCGLASYCSEKCKQNDRGRHEADCDVAKLVRKCSGCGVSKEDLKQCGNCSEAWYCDAKCQKKHRRSHKLECYKVSAGIVWLVVILNSKESRFPLREHHLFYWGNVPAVDLFNLSLNESSSYARPLSALLCGVGDPRNVALSLASLPEGYSERVTFVLNDISVCTLARMVLLLYMLLEGEQRVVGSIGAGLRRLIYGPSYR